MQRQTVFGDDPVEFARRWKDAGAKCLHLVDLDAAKGDDSTANREAVATSRRRQPDCLAN